MFIEMNEFMVVFVSLYFGAILVFFISLFYGLYAVIIRYFYLAEEKIVLCSEQRISMIIPCFNEEKIIVDKIRNTVLLDYPKSLLEIIFVDGGSTDHTRELVLKEIKKFKHIKFVETQQKGKIHQINEVLKDAKGDVIVISDADGLLDPSVLKVFSKRLESQIMGAVGACVSPAGNLAEEKVYWDLQNYLRSLESRFYSSSIIIGVCYAFRKKIISEYPDDVVADDIYVAFKTVESGFRVVYDCSAKVVEVRTPVTLKELIVHKSRKANAYLKELFRFKKKFLFSPLRWKIVFYNKLAQFTLVPVFSGVLFLSALIDIVYHAAFHQIVFILILSAAFLVFFESISSLHLLKSIIISNLVILFNLIRFPFYRQNSSYEKIK